jgi:dolichol-phosphate mannosyltransferase
VKLDIVIPAHNEQHRIDSTLATYRTACPSPATRFLVALDDCTDDTAAVVATHADQDPRVVAMPYPRLGKGGVLLETFRRTSADLVAFVDADCATPPAELLRLVEAVDTLDADVVIASRWHPASVVPVQRSLGRRVASVGFSLAVRRLFHLPFRDTQCGAKVVRRSAAERIVPLLSSRDFVFDVDLLLTARSLGFRIAEVPTIWIDRAGSRVRPLADTGRMAASLGRLWLHHRVVPVRMPASPAFAALTAPVPPPAAAPRVIDLTELERADVPAGTARETHAA